MKRCPTPGICWKMQNQMRYIRHHAGLILRRNDLSRCCDNVVMNYYEQVHYYSRVIHLVSGMWQCNDRGANRFGLHSTPLFRRGTLSGAPKFKTMLTWVDRPTYSSLVIMRVVLASQASTVPCIHAVAIGTPSANQNMLHYQAGAVSQQGLIPKQSCRKWSNKAQRFKRQLMYNAGNTCRKIMMNPISSTALGIRLRHALVPQNINEQWFVHP